jgi:hypothetical protein
MFYLFTHGLGVAVGDENDETNSSSENEKETAAGEEMLNFCLLMIISQSLMFSLLEVNF